jgi:peptidyl-prolyl cis-trans isomerase C
MDLARQPLLHFLVIGAAIALLYGWLADPDAARPDRTIRITAASISQLEAQWRARWNRAPTPEELDGLIRAQIREAALYREALAMGLNEDDPVIRRVLVQKLEGIARDLVEVSLSPTEQDLSTYFAEHADRYRPPALITFTHVFLDPDRRGEQTLQDADEILAELQSLGPPPQGIEEFGDPFMLQRYYPQKTEQRIASLFGREFARSVFELPAGRWHGPVLSGYGTHLVYVDGLAEFPTPTLAAVEDRVRQDWVDGRREEITGQYFAQLLARYDVIVERESADASSNAATAQAP